MILREHVPISQLTTMRLGGKARYVADAATPEEVAEAYRLAQSKQLPTFALGGGANTIGQDSGFNGIIIRNQIKGIEILSTTDDAVTIKAMGGEIWDDLVAFACERGYTGIEALSAIPGTVGAAPVQNIGAYGQDAAKVLVSAEAYDTWEGGTVEIPVSDMNFNYRKSIFNSGPEAGRYFILSITIKLKIGQMDLPLYDSLQKYLDEHQIKEHDPAIIRAAVIAIRKEKLPDPAVLPSAGSFFKNVHLTAKQADAAEAKGLRVYRGHGENKINTGWLIEACGLKGKLLHGMRVSDKAALILINESAKSYADLAAARAEIIKTINERYGYIVEQEPVEIPEVM